MRKRRASLYPQQSAHGALPWGCNFQDTKQSVTLKSSRVTGVKEGKDSGDQEANPLDLGRVATSCVEQVWRTGLEALPAPALTRSLWPALSSSDDNVALVPSLRRVVTLLQHLITKPYVGNK